MQALHIMHVRIMHASSLQWHRQSNINPTWKARKAASRPRMDAGVVLPCTAVPMESAVGKG